MMFSMGTIVAQNRSRSDANSTSVGIFGAISSAQRDGFQAHRRRVVWRDEAKFARSLAARIA